MVGCVAESDDDEDESSHKPVAKPPISEVHKAIEILEKFTVFSRSGEDLMSSLKVVNRVMLKNNLAKSNQPSVLILEKKSEVKYAIHICLFVHPPLTLYSGR